MINLNIGTAEQIVEEYEQSLVDERESFRKMIIANLEKMIQETIKSNVINKNYPYSFYCSNTRQFGITISLGHFKKMDHYLTKQYVKWAKELVLELEDVNWTFKLSKDGKNILCLSKTATKRV